MRNQRYVDTLGATAACTLRLLEGCVPADDINGGHGIQGDAWFGSVRAAAAIGAKGHRAVLQVKNNSGLYPKAFIDGALKNAPGGVHIVLKGVAPNGVELVALGYRYSTKTTLFFIATADAGSTRPGTPYEMKYTDDHGNVCLRHVERPDIISNFFRDSNAIDRHNQSRQFDLALEKTWLTQEPYFRLATTIIGMHVVDSWKLADYHNIINGANTKDENRMTVKRFAGVLCYQLVTNTCAFLSNAFAPSTSPSEIVVPAQRSISMSSDTNEDSEVTMQEGQDTILIPKRSLADKNGVQHHQVAYPKTVGKSGKRSTLTRECKMCKEKGEKHLVGFYCFTCGDTFAYCCPNRYNSDRDCFKDHVDRIPRSSSRSRG